LVLLDTVLNVNISGGRKAKRDWTPRAISETSDKYRHTKDQM